MLSLVEGEQVDISDFPATTVIEPIDKISAYRCSAFIFHERWVATAAHCLHPDHGNMSAENYQIRVGSTQANFGGNVYRLEMETWHPDYDLTFSQGDIGLVKTTEPIRLSDIVQIATLPEAVALLEPGTMCTVVGFGLTHISEWDVPENIRLWKAEIPILDKKIYTNKYGYYNATRQVCAGTEDTRFEATQGDSGGQLYCDGVAVGVVNGGGGFAGSPSYYAGTGFYREFIDKTINENG